MSDSFLTDHPTLTYWPEESEGGLEEEDLDYPDYDSDLEEDFYDDYEDEEMDEDDLDDDDEISRKSPLSWAVQNNHADIVRLLLSREDIQPDLPDSEGQTPLYLACNSGNEEVVGLLLERGVAVDPNLQAPWYGFSPLAVAASHRHEGVVKLLLTRNDIDPSIRNHDGQTALSIAASGGHEGVVKLLLAWGPIDLNSTDSLHRRSALGHAACKGHKGVVELLLACEGTEPNHIDVNGQTALAIAAEKGYLDIVRVLLDREDIDPSLRDVWGRSLLCHAICRGWEGIVKALVARPDLDLNGASVGDGLTALSLAVVSREVEVVRILLERDDVNVNLADKYGRSPLWHAMESGVEVITKMLVARGGLKTGPEFGSEGRPVPVLLANCPIVRRMGEFFLFAGEYYLPPNM